jgi:hypothetical protein
MRFSVILFAFISLLPSPLLCAADKDKNFEGTVAVTEMRGGVSTQTIYTRKGDQLRIENPDKSKPEPINIVDLAAKKLTIVYPHNSSFVVVDLATRPSVAGVGDPGGSAPGASMPVGPGSTIPATTLAQVGPAISPPPGFPSPPPMPSMPPMPNNLMASGMPKMPLGGAPIGAGGAPALPNPGIMPPMPGMGTFGGTPELKKTDKTKKIQGFDCALYTISDRMETFEIWATPDSALFPFRLVRPNYLNRHFGPRMIDEQWIELLQKQSLFPLEAILRTDPRPQAQGRAGTSPAPSAGVAADRGQERLSFKVEKIEKKKVDNEKLFQPPEGYFEIQSPG